LPGQTAQVLPVLPGHGDFVLSVLMGTQLARVNGSMQLRRSPELPQQCFFEVTSTENRI
jgi:hypothetical protein